MRLADVVSSAQRRAERLQASWAFSNEPHMTRLITIVALTGGSSNQAPRLRQLAGELSSLLRRRLRKAKRSKPRQAQHRLTSKHRDQLVAEYLSGASMLALAKRWGLHRTTVAEHLRRAGVGIRQRGIPAEKLNEAIRLYTEGWSCQRLAERYDCDDETVRQTLKRAGTTLRAPWERNGSDHLTLKWRLSNA